ncbi:MAG: hypothetical protein RLZZ156_1409 [Deinococcota bacterium]|jgi:hypothetical protein
MKPRKCIWLEAQINLYSTSFTNYFGWRVFHWLEETFLSTLFWRQYAALGSIK